MATHARYVRWDDPSVEPQVANESDKIAAIQAIINDTQRKNFALHRHAFRGTHVKTQGVVKGGLTILPDLPPELAHGLASPANASEPHDVAIRFANEPSFLQDDKGPGPRGMGMKVFSVSGDFLESEGRLSKTQDLTFNNAPLLELGDVNRCLEIFDIRNKHFLEPEKIAGELEQRDDEELQKAPMRLPNHHFLAYTMYSQSAYRWGPYVAKYALFPSSEQEKMKDSHRITDESDIDQHSIWLRDHFQTKSAEYTLCVQLCEDLSKQPVEDTTVQWDEEQFPFRPVAKVVIPGSQDSFDAQRRIHWEERMRLNVWYGLEEMRPLGSVNRLRRTVYQASKQFREEMNVTSVNNVDSVREIP